MTPLHWVAWAGAVAAAGGWAAYLYLRREPRIPGRPVLLGIRAAALALILLLLFDPRLPWASADAPPELWVLVDASASMAAGPEGATPWARAREAARDAPGAAPLVLVGEGAGRPADSLPAEPPFETSRLAPALERAAEGGARRVRIVGDLRVEDAAAAAATAERLGLEVAVEDVGGELRNAAVATLRVPEGIPSGEPLEGEVEVAAQGAAGETAVVELLRDGEVVDSLGVELPAPGLRSRASFSLPAPEVRGPVRLQARVRLPDDAFGADDARTAVTTVDPQEGNLVLVALEPDWEPRFLLPVLEGATGLPGRGFLALASGGFLATGAQGAAGTAGAPEVAAMARAAEILVIQGSGDAVPAWLRDAAASVSRVLLLPGAGTAPPGMEAATGTPRPGEWYVVPEVEPSPLAGALSGIELQGLPPVTAVRPWQGSPGTAPPLRVQRGGTGPTLPLLVLRERDEGREAMLLGRGLWRWAFRPGASRETYERLWSATAGWLLASDGGPGPGIRPLAPVQPGGRPVEWVAGARAGDRVRVEVGRADTVVLDTVVRVPEAGPLRTAALAPGSYRYRARVLAGEDPAGGDPAGGDTTAPDTSTAAAVAGPPAADTAPDPPAGGPPAGGPSEGALEIEAWSGDLLHPRDTTLARAGGDGVASGSAAGRPLRTHPLPWLLALALLSVEWIGRRRRGLR